MKKIVIFLIAVIASICYIVYIYNVNETNMSMAVQKNSFYEGYYKKQIYGADIATIISTAMNSNYRNDVEKDKKNMYIENDTNSIKINIKMLDNDTVYPMEAFSNGGIEHFVEYYNKIEFKCTDIQYHEKTKMVKSMLFEQVTI